ncbi:MAG: helix-turn-helix transcriptional regulator [Ruminococcus sp.]|nr:helix-turn-helix transcriptional regulator [Ruminococcus sp.]
MLNSNTLSIKIKELRKARNISQVELAKALFVSKQSVSNWENDNIMPSIEMLIKIAAFFSVSTDYLLGLDNNNNIIITEGLNKKEIEHIKLIINDLTNAHKK